MNKLAIITGATSGIGKSTAIKLAQSSWNLIITGRREDRLKLLEDEIKSKFNVDCLSLCFDVRDKKQVINAISELKDEWRNIDLLVNNAGLALGLSTIDNADETDWEVMIDTNVKGLLNVTSAILPLMKHRQNGHIINIGSIAGVEVYPNGNVYCATKHAVNALTKAMRIDLVQHNIKVSQVLPGAVETEFSLVRFKGDKDKAGKVYDGFVPLDPDNVADIILYTANQPEHVNIAEVLILPKSQAAAGIIKKDL